MKQFRIWLPAGGLGSPGNLQLFHRYFRRDRAGHLAVSTCFSAARTARVGTKVAPPFAMKDADGTAYFHRSLAADGGEIGPQVPINRRAIRPEPWWRHLAWRLRSSVAAITITADRERKVDFSQPFYDTGLGIAVPTNNVSVWNEITRTLTSFGFLQAAGALIGISLLAGVLPFGFSSVATTSISWKRRQGPGRQHLVVRRGDDAGKHG